MIRGAGRLTVLAGSIPGTRATFTIRTARHFLPNSTSGFNSELAPSELEVGFQPTSGIKSPSRGLLWPQVT